MANKRSLQVDDEIPAGEIPAEEVQELMELDTDKPVAEAEVKLSHLHVKKNRVAIFQRNWMEVASLSPNLLDKSMKSWKKDQVVFVDSDIDRLIALNAPIKVYVEDGVN